MKQVLFFFSILFLFPFGLVAQNASNTRMINLGSQVNSSLRELAPFISPDGQTLYVMVYGHEQNKGNADIWYSNWDKKKEAWGVMKQMPSPFNQIAYNQVMSVTPDGNTMMVRGIVEKDVISSKDYSIIKRTPEGWSPPEAIQIEGYKEMNNGAMYAAALSNNAKILVMSFEEEDKSNDLYVSFLKGGKWTRPISLGTDLNTEETEFSPFLASDNKTLYLSSNKPDGLGGYDIYYSRRLDDTWQNWTVPKNVGAPVNSSGNEMYYTISASADYAYFASTQNSLGDYDIFKIALKDEEKPLPVVLVYGKVLNAKTGESIRADINFSTLPEGKEAGIAESNPVTGEYKIILPYGYEYSFEASLDQFIAVSDRIDLSGEGSYREIQRDLKMVPKEVGATILMNNVFFETAKAELIGASRKELQKVVSFLIDNPTLQIEISGHTDAVGSDASNMAISEMRAKAVQSWLLQNGAVASQIVIKGYGESQPVAPNDTEEGRAKNRRVEFTILKEQ